MMKKNGFTLAEVLITLAIIGVVATMTLPALITNTGEQQNKTGLKKIINTLSEAGQLHQALAGFDFGNLIKPTTDDYTSATADDEQSIITLLRARTAIDYGTTQNGQKNPFPNADGKNTIEKGKKTHEAVDRFVSFRDGTILMYKNGDESADTVKVMQSDGLPAGFLVTVDVNGPKGPNVLANCAATGATKAGADDSATTADACTSTKNSRFIADRFILKIRGSSVEPVGAAASWTLQN